jgi:DNA polymerase I-like protein with 3'-5' exonuclease and polymerase domains
MIWDDDKVCAFDFETSGTIPEYALQPWRLKSGDFWATSLVWVWPEGGELHVDGGLNPDRPMMARFLAFLKSQARRGVGWNTVFDLSVLAAYGFEDEIMGLRWLDGMLIYRHLEVEPEYEMTRANKRSFGLKPAVATFIPDQAGYEEDIDYHDPSPTARAKLHEYNVRDNIFTLRITKKLWPLLTPRQLKSALIEAECLPLAALANLDGLLIDTLACQNLVLDLSKEADDALIKLQWFGVTEEVIRSPKKLAALMFDQWQLPVLKHNTGKKSGMVSRSTDKEVLHELSFIDPKVRTLRIYREALNNRTKFADAPLASVAYNGDGRAHPLARVFGTYSGRLTYSSKQGKNKDERQIGFALHQEKREAKFRKIVTVPPEYDLMEFDAAGQEFRWMAVKTGDTVMMQLCMPGEDAHAFMAARVTDQDYKPLMVAAKVKESKAWWDRYLGKVANLSLQYRTSAPKLRTVARVQYNLPMQLPQAKLIHVVYQRTYREVPKYWQAQIALGKKLGYAETLAGRRVKVMGDWGAMGWSMGSTMINYPVQGTGADQKYLALMVIKDYVWSIGARFKWDLHDGIYLQVPKTKTKEAAVTIKHMLDNLPYKKAWGIDLPIPMPWDCKIGPTWGGLRDYDFEK